MNQYDKGSMLSEDDGPVVKVVKVVGYILFTVVVLPLTVWVLFGLTVALFG